MTLRENAICSDQTLLESVDDFQYYIASSKKPSIAEEEKILDESFIEQSREFERKMIKSVSSGNADREFCIYFNHIEGFDLQSRVYMITSFEGSKYDRIGELKVINGVDKYGIELSVIR